MRSFLSRRVFFASSRLAGRSAARIPGLPPPPGRASRFPFEIHRIPKSTAVAAAALLSPCRSIHGVPEEAPKLLPTDLAVGLSQEMEGSGGVEEEVAAEEEDGPMNEFLSRFVWMMRQKLVEAFPDSSRETLDGMLLMVAQKVVAEMEEGGGVLPSVGLADPSIDFSPDLWRTVWEVSKSAFEETRRTRRRKEMRKFLHCDDVKEMCRFASAIGIRGDMLRELRFKWAHEKLEESEFYRNLERIRENAAAAELVGEGENPAEVTEKPTLTALPERKGKLKYKIHDLDLSGQNWAEVADKIHEAEKRIAPEEPQPIMGKCKLVTEEILNLKGDIDPAPLLAKWVELLQPKRADWLALLGRVHEHNPAAYFKWLGYLGHLV
ncbi:hypothetical protein Taro_032280 [Colocasia esculenta]|uniref:Uncharacterized protein n=1 Tax=Colocasia esculenta TaxID=4460 RepID=A0A843W8Z9_COLES|nr:hypothetical protein [Colocasia esculenta]